MFVKGNMKWQTEYSVSGIGSVSNFSIVNTLTPAPDPVSFCSPPCVGQEGVHPQNRSWRHHPCQNHSNFTTHGICEHNTGARWKTARRTNSVTAWAIWNECSRPTSLDLVDPYLYACQVWISLLPNTSHMNPLDQPDKFKTLHFWLLIFSLCWATCHVCIWQKYSHLRRETKELEDQRWVWIR